MAKSIIQLIANKDASVDAAIKDLEKIKKLQDSINKQGVSLGKSTNAKQAATNVDKLSRSYDSYTNAVKRANNRVKEEKEIEKDVARRKRILIKLNRAQAGSYDQLSAKLSLSKLKWKQLSEEQRKNSKIGKRLLIEQKQLTNQLKKMDASVGVHTRNVGNYGKALGGLKKAMGVLGVAGGIALLGRGLKSVISIFSEFDSTMSKVRAVSGANKEEFKQLRDDAKRLGESTEKTAAQVGSLQLEFAKLGFTTPQIIGMTEATLNLSTAAGADLGQSAEVVGATMKAFGLSAKDTGRVTDIMAKSFSSSALDMEKFAVSMRAVAPVAKNAGLGLEETTGMLSVLVNRGIDASTAGTGLRNVFLELTKKGLTFEEAMDKIQKSSNKNATSLDLFGKRGAVIGTILAENTEEANELTKAYLNSSGAAENMANIMRDNLAGDADKAKSAMQGLAIAIGERLNGGLRSIVQGFTKFVSILAGTYSAAREAKQEYLELKAELDATEETLNPLIERYDELTSKTSLNEDEQEELKDTIHELGKEMPFLITEFDKYGNALDINRGKLDKYLNKQRELLEIIRKGALEEFVKEAETAAVEIATIEEMLAADQYIEYISGIPVIVSGASAKQQRKQAQKSLELRGELRRTLKEMIDMGNTYSDIGEAFRTFGTKSVEIGGSMGILLESLGLTELSADDRRRFNRIIKAELDQLRDETRETIEATEEEIVVAATGGGSGDKKVIEKVIVGRINRINKAISEANKRIGEAGGTPEEVREKIKVEQQHIETLKKIKDELLGIASAQEEVAEETKKTTDIMKTFTKFTKNQLEEMNKSEFEKFWDKQRDSVRLFADTAISEIDRSLQARKDALDEETKQQQSNLDKQEERAMSGMANTLAFEKEQLAKRKAEQERQRQSEIRLAKVKAWYNIVANSKSIPEALKKLAIVTTAETLFEKGGVVEDEIKKKAPGGIFKGRRHSQGGIPINVEGKEGIFSRREMSNLGKDNFYSLKNKLNRKMPDNLFENQAALIPVAKVSNESAVISKLDSLERTIRDKQEISIDVDGFRREINETIKQGNKVVKNKYPIKKRI